MTQEVFGPAVFALWRRELVHFFRQPARIAGAVGSPLLFWLFLGSGLSSSFQLPGNEAGPSYFRYFFPGTITLVVVFAAIFASISLIQDRNAGFLQGVLAAPVSRSAIVLGKVLGGATIAWVQGVLFLALAPLAGIPFSWSALLAAAGALAATAFVISALGFACAWRIETVQGYHAVMNLVMLPMWLLSGALFPADGAPVWISLLMRINPLAYGLALLRATLDPAAVPAGSPTPTTALAATLVFGVVFLVAGLLTIAASRRPSKTSAAVNPGESRG